jgi:Cysteine-rich secretory protein family
VRDQNRLIFGGCAVLAAFVAPALAVSARTYAAHGIVQDLGAQRFAADGGAAGVPIAGATVVVGPRLIVGATPPAVIPRGDVTATTARDGTYAATGYDGRGTTYVVVFPPAGDGHVSLHARAAVADNGIRPLYLYAPTAAETAELALIAGDRAANGAGPLVPDEIAFETARAHADFMAANGYYQHCIPATRCDVVATFPTEPPSSFPPRYVSPNDLYTALGGALELAPGANWTENFYVGWPSSNASYASWPVADGWFMAEKCNVTASCPNGPVEGGYVKHYKNIVDPAHTWVGLGDNANARPALSAGKDRRVDAFADFVQEFYSARE